MNTIKTIGYVGVDAGCIWVGDPCYVIGKDASFGFEDWGEYCDKLAELEHWQTDSPDYCEPAGSGIGMHIQTLYGDGSYPVIATFNEQGRVTKVTIDFNPESDD